MQRDIICKLNLNNYLQKECYKLAVCASGGQRSEFVHSAVAPTLIYKMTIGGAVQLRLLQL